METKKVTFTVTPNDQVKAYWIAVGNDDIPLVNGKGSINLQAPQRHFLIWWFVGNSGSTLNITGESGIDTLVEVKNSTIPQGEHEGAGVKRFQL